MEKKKKKKKRRIQLLPHLLERNVVVFPTSRIAVFQKLFTKRAVIIVKRVFLLNCCWLHPAIAFSPLCFSILVLRIFFCFFFRISFNKAGIIPCRGRRRAKDGHFIGTVSSRHCCMCMLYR